MHPCFKDYVWKFGIPHGIGTGDTIRIVTDPYRRRFSVEKYQDSKFLEVVYDSQLLDFRDLHPKAQTAWRKELVEETPEKIVYLIRNQDDRVVYQEVNHFVESRCVECEIFSTSRTLLSTHKLYYEDRGAPFNGVILFDRVGKEVMRKVYTFSTEDQTFTQLLAEEWDLTLD